MATRPRSAWWRNVDAGWSFFGAPAPRPQPEEALRNGDFAHQLAGQAVQSLGPGQVREFMGLSPRFVEQKGNRLLAAPLPRFPDRAEALERVEAGARHRPAGQI